MHQFCESLPQLVRCIRDWRKKRKSRLSRKFLRQLPTTKYKKGDIYETCAICLEDYVEGTSCAFCLCTRIKVHCPARHKPNSKEETDDKQSQPVNGGIVFCLPSLVAIPYPLQVHQAMALHNKGTCPHLAKRKVVLPGMTPTLTRKAKTEGTQCHRAHTTAGRAPGGGGGGRSDSSPSLFRQPTEATLAVRGSANRPIIHTASFHHEDSGMPTSSSCPTHVSTAHSLNRDVDSSSISSGAEDEVQVRPSQSASTQGESQHHLRL
ncbi:uncharacterized protein LOC125757872 [Rhipicephalus sanguineus]|uniref:uncharacterized protein LOC125757872 n=1 Tax=Rhipicephalus sanguineus TaxID=34632 RepID=UPI0020C487D7|nr:uncharacterized protein LOC125757872 [Rhipicephalus sanguineus]